MNDVDGSPELKNASMPSRIGSYELLVPLGRGGMATVYLARKRVVDQVWREVALKVIHPFMLDEEDQPPAHFVNEARIAARIQHPNVVEVQEVGTSEHGPYIAMDYVRGLTLSELRRSTHPARLPTRISLRIACDALNGLHAAHELNDEAGASLHLVHRDVSPQNILVGIDGIAKLADFGIARTANRTDRTVSGTVKGKAGYMAPEQAMGQGIDRRTDIWAMGVVLWELIAGRRLFMGQHPMETMYKILNERPAHLHQIRSDVPRDLADLVAVALSLRPDDRFATALDFRRELMAVSGPVETDEVAGLVQRAAVATLESRAQRVSQVLDTRQREESSRAAVVASSGFVAGPRPKSRWRSLLSIAVAVGVAATIAVALNWSARAPVATLRRGVAMPEIPQLRIVEKPPSASAAVVVAPTRTPKTSVAPPPKTKPAKALGATPSLSPNPYEPPHK